MKKLIFLFEHPKSTVILIDADPNHSSRNEIDNDLLFLEPSKFPTRVIEIAFNNRDKEKLENILFVFDGELDKVNGVILFNETLNYFSYKENYNFYNLRNKFSSFVNNPEKIKLLSQLDFYSTLMNDKKIEYLSLLIYVGNTVSVELGYDKVIRTNLNADIKLILLGEKSYKASELLSNNYLMKNSDGNYTDTFTNNLAEVILFFISDVKERNLTVNSIQIVSNKTEFIKENILSERLKTNFNIHKVSNLQLDFEGKLNNKKYQFFSIQDIVYDPIKYLPIVFSFLLAPLIPIMVGAISISYLAKKKITKEKLSDIVNRINKIILKSSIGDLIKEFTSVSELQDYIEQNFEVLDPISKVEFIDLNNRIITYSLSELNNISNFSNLEMKLGATFHPLIGEMNDKKLLLKKIF
ncbi:MAG: hypothetical protein K8F60_04860 [Melioribacteraceae bacterium]|nr:hypothetical protein [Melioribacteraceae bacterium]